MAANYTVDLITEIDKGLRFNVIVTFTDDEGVDQLCFGITGFRLMTGCILPPANFSKGRWYTPIIVGKDGARGIYEALVLKLKKSELTQEYVLGPFEAATDTLVDTYKMKMNFPSVFGV